MSEHTANIIWTRSSNDFDYNAFSRAHTWSFPGGEIVPASSAPDFRGDPERVNPEEALVAAVSSCHMLTFLAIAARKRFVVERYTDHPAGVLTKNEGGKLWVSRVTLRPAVLFSGERRPRPEEIEAMHRSAHDHCIVAASLRSEVLIEPQPAAQ
jgi:organic hydroperoxide reductase OsmC/OhrA